MTGPRFWNRNLAAAFVVGALLWTLGGINHSLWMDEFHSLEHARGGKGVGVLSSLSTSNHPPLSFLLLACTETLFGDSHLALRCWSIIVGLLTLLLAAQVGRRLPTEAGRQALPWLVVFSSFACMIFTEARMYGLMALAVLGLMEAVMTSLEGRRRNWWLSLWIVIGLHSHYYFIHYGFVLSLACIAAAVTVPAFRPGFVRLLLPATVGVLLFIPWALTGFADQLSHSLPSGGSSGVYLNLNGFVQSIAHLLFMNASLGGEWASMYVALPGAALGALLGGMGLGNLWRRRREGEGLFLTFLLFAGLLAPLWSFSIAFIFDRAGYTWRYIAGSCVPVLILVAAGMNWRPILSRAISVTLLGTMAVITMVSVFSPGVEDYRGSVRHVLNKSRAGDAIVLRPSRFENPEISPTGWDYYRKHLGRWDEPDQPTAYRLADHAEAFSHDRVWIYYGYRFPPEVLSAFEERYAHHEITKIGSVMTVHLFSN